MVKNEKNNHLISIILPTYNGGRFIKHAIQGCINQSYKNWELIIVIDGSTDNTINKINTFHDKRIRYYYHKNNLGIPKSLNIGFKKAKGHYFTWTSDDNFYKKKALENMLDYLIKTKFDFVYADFSTIDGYGKIRHDFKRPQSLAIGNIVGPCFLYTKNLKDTIGNYNCKAELIEDYDYWIRSSKTFDLHHLRKNLYYYRLHKDNLTYKKGKEIQILTELIKIEHHIIEPEEAVQRIFLIIHSQMSQSKKIVLVTLFLKIKISRIINKLYYKQISFMDARDSLTKLFSRQYSKA